jgi:TolA-binding protein
MEQARAEFKRGMEAYQTGDYGTARIHFDNAYRISHKAQLLYNLIQVANKQGDHAGACNYYRELQQRAASDPRIAKIFGRTKNPCPTP